MDFRTYLSKKLYAYRTSERYDRWLHEHVILLITSPKFLGLIMLAVLCNSITIALETYPLHREVPQLFKALNYVFFIIYSLEFLLKLYAQPILYWKSWYNLFDFFVLSAALVQIFFQNYFVVESSEKSLLQVLTAFRALRALRLVSFIKGVQILVEVLLQTFKSTVLYMLLLLALIMFLAAVFGHILFGANNPERWGDLFKAMLTLFIFVTADGWYEMTSDTGDRIFTVAFIFIGHFIFTNLFIGVIVMNIHSATLRFQESQKEKRECLLKAKKEYMMKKQHEELEKLQEKQMAIQFKNFQELAKAFHNTIREDEFVMMNEHVTTLTWLKTILTTMDHLDIAKDNSMNLHFELAETLARLKEDRMNESSHK